MQKEIAWLLKDKYSGKPTKQFNRDVARLKVGEPLDYVIGFTEFLGYKIDLSKKPLIPRPETEFWVERAIQEMHASVRVLDMFAGSGCIGIAVLKHTKKSQVVFAEKDKNLCGQIRKNIKINKIASGKCKIVPSDMFSNIHGRFDYIFANPPYIPTTRKNNVQQSVLKYEPKGALFGGRDGLRHIKKFLAKAKLFLKTGGTIFLEFDSIQKNGLSKLLKKHGYRGEFHKDQFGKYRYAVIRVV